MRSRWLNYSKTINEAASYVSAQSNSDSGGSSSQDTTPNVTTGPGIFISDEGVISAGSLIT